MDFSVQYIYLSLYFVLDFFSCVCAFVFRMGVQYFNLLGVLVLLLNAYIIKLILSHTTKIWRRVMITRQQ